MRGLKDYIYNTLNTDTTITTTLGAKVFAGGVDKIEAYPCVTIEEVSATTLLNPPLARTVVMNITCWSQNSNLECEKLYEQVWTDLNMARTNTPLSQKIFMSQEDNTHESFDKDRRLWRKSSDIRFWTK